MTAIRRTYVNLKIFFGWSIPLWWTRLFFRLGMFLVRRTQAYRYKRGMLSLTSNMSPRSEDRYARSVEER